MKVCKTCKVEKPLSAYRISKRREKQWHHNECAECMNTKYMARYYENHDASKEALRHKVRKAMYGITKEDYYTLLESQGNCCAICKAKVAGGRGDWHVDHNHDTGKIRGLLCHHCNTGLGLFKDDEQLLMNARDYLHERK